MSTQRPGFTLVELILVALLGAIIMGAAVQAMIQQERTYRATGEIIRGQDGIRTALGVLESELREVATAGASIGASDIVAATRDSIVFRAQRKLGFVCGSAPNDKRVFTWSLGTQDRFAAGDRVLIFRDEDQTWIPARAHNVQNSTSGCTAKPATLGNLADQRIDLQALGGAELGNNVLVGVLPGAPIRGLHHVTYGIYSMNGEWVLARRQDGGELSILVAGLAPPGEGLVFEYLDATGQVISSGGLLDFLFPPASVRSVRITARSQPRVGSGAQPVELTSTVFLRNN